MADHKISKIIGLDPAGPCYEAGYFTFYQKPDKVKGLDKTQALFVTGIITSANKYGMKREFSHVGVRVNGGDKSCPEIVNGNRKELILQLKRLYHVIFQLFG